jgi:predicted transcriptional regulator
MSQLVQDAPKDQLIATHVDALTRDELIALARREDRSVSWVLRRALATYLERGDNDEEREEA